MESVRGWLKASLEQMPSKSGFCVIHKFRGRKKFVCCWLACKVGDPN